MNKIEWEWTIFTVQARERKIFTVHKWEQKILQYAHFQDLMRNDWEMTKNEWRMNGNEQENMLMTDITCSHLPFINSQERDFSKTILPR